MFSGVSTDLAVAFVPMNFMHNVQTILQCSIRSKVLYNLIYNRMLFNYDIFLYVSGWVLFSQHCIIRDCLTVTVLFQVNLQYEN